MTQVTTIDTNNFDAMAQAMGLTENSKSKSSGIPRLRIWHKPIMGIAEVNGKKVNMEIIEGGMFRLQIPDGPTYYASSINMRVYLQRFLHKRFIKGVNNKPNTYVKTVMSETLDIDLKDDAGGFNCGKQAGFIKDWEALPEKQKELIRQIKRTRAVFGTVEMINPVDEKGEPVELEVTPFIWEIDNRDAFKTVGDVLSRIAKMKRYPVQHNILVNTQANELNNGENFYTPVVSFDITKPLELTETEQEMFSNFVSWVDSYNAGIANKWAEKARSVMDEDEVDVISDLVDITDEEVEVQ